MRKHSIDPSAGESEPLRQFAKALVPHLQELMPTTVSPPVAYYHQGDSPLGRRLHLALVRKEVLTGRKVGRKVLVRRDEVHAYIESQRSVQTLKHDDDPLDDWGLEPKERP